MEIGVLLPHFGEHADVETLVQGSRRVEELGYDSVWVRDHILWRPHGMEGSDLTFIEPLLTLAAISSVTTRVKLGMGVLIPIRWPLKVAQNLATLSVLSKGRVIGGYGLGSNPAEFQAAGLSRDDREQIFSETMEILRLVWNEDSVSHHGEIFRFDDVTLEPKPVAPIPMLSTSTAETPSDTQPMSTTGTATASISRSSTPPLGLTSTIIAPSTRLPRRRARSSKIDSSWLPPLFMTTKS